MVQWGITLENIYRFTREKWKPIASKTVAFWRESREASSHLDPKFRIPKREQDAWLLWKDVADALEMKSIFRLREPPEDDARHQEVYERSSRKLKILVEPGKYPKDLNIDGSFRSWRTEWNCW